MEKDVELLAPAGCFASLQAALDAAADAVYFGVAQLNMRARARRTFESRDMAEVVRRAQTAGARAYLTLNTLLYDHDLSLAQSLLEEAARCGVDGVIVADMAAMGFARRLGLEVHISTQLAVSNYEALRFFAAWSDRVVLARELSLPLIRRLAERIDRDDLRGPSGRLLEIEAFAHGAQCIAIAGRCGMSLYTSNASANRGACEQNCRKRYEVKDLETGERLVLDNEFVMSPSDICTIDFLDELLASGVGVLKIEGRARAPEYVYTVTNAYRRALDAIAAGRYDRALVQELLADLSKVYHRGLGSGYYLGRAQVWSGAYGSKATRKKVEVGRVSNYFPHPGVAAVEVTGEGLSLGDEFVVIGKTTGVVEGTVTELRVEGECVSRVGAKMVFSLPVPRKVRKNDKLYWMRRVDGTNPT